MSELLAPEAERTVIGAVIVANGDMATVAAVLTPRHFGDSRNRRIFEAMTALYERSEPIDLLTLKSELGEELEAAGGIGYLAGMIDGVPRITNVETWARMVLEAARRRALVTACRQAIDAAEGQQVPTDEILSSHEEALRRIMLNQRPTVRPMSAVMPEVYRSLEEFAASQTGITGIPCGLPDVDRMLGGFRDGGLYVVAAWPGRGKSALATQWAIHAAERGRRVLFFSMEMPDREVTERILLGEARVDKWRELRRGGDAVWERLATAQGRLQAACSRVMFDSRETATLAQIRATARQHQVAGGLDLLIVDHLQRMAIPAGSKERWDGVGRNIEGLKSIARSLDVPVIACSQLNGEAGERRPNMGDLAQARQAISAEADAIAFLHPEEPKEFLKQEAPRVKFLLDKHRHGWTGEIPLSFEKSIGRFVCLATEGDWNAA